MESKKYCNCRNKLLILVLTMLFGFVGYSQIVVDSLEELLPYLKQDNVNVTLSPGEYYINEDDITNGTFSNPLFLFEGSNSTYDFTNAKMNISTVVLTKFGNVDVNEFQILGNNNVLKNLTIEDVGTTAPSKRAQNIVMDGRDNRIEGFKITARGSYPYGYGDVFGKGGGSVINHRKHSVLLVRGLRNHVKNCHIVSRSYGHVIFMQAASYPTIEGCYVEGEMRTTDDILSEEGTSSAADNVDFMTVWGYKLPAGYMVSLQEAGIRAYNAGTTYIDGEEIERGTDNPTVLNCTIKNTRTGVTLAHASGSKYVEGCTVIGCEQGYSVGSSSKVINCGADAIYGPVYKNAYSSDNGYDADITILPPSAPYYNGHQAIAYIGGKNHNLIFRSDIEEFPSDLKIMMAGDMQNLRLLNGSNPSQNNHTVENVSLTNLSNFPVVVHSDTSNSTVKICDVSKVVNNSNNTTVTEVDCESENLALTGVASQSSTGYEGVAGRAIDGNYDGAWSVSSVTHTNTEEYPWWQVELTSESIIKSVNIYGRTDSCCKARLSDYTLFVYNEQGEETFSKQFTSYPNPLETVVLENVVAKRVKIVLNGSSVALSLAEVEVLGVADALLSNTIIDFENPLMSIFPNPTNGMLTLSLDSQELSDVESFVLLFNTQGQKILEKTVSNEMSKVVLDLSDLEKGLYFLKWFVNDNVRIKKVMKY